MSDALELELRQIPGVAFVAFGEGDGSLLIELLVDRAIDEGSVRSEALRLAENHVDRPVEVQFAVVERAVPTAERVKLIVVLPWPEWRGVEIHLAIGNQRSSCLAVSEDLVPVARSTVEALRQLGYQVPYTVVSVEALSASLGGGALVMLRHGVSRSLRRGMAGGRNLEEAVARATLDALNRFLEAPARPVDVADPV